MGRISALVLAVLLGATSVRAQDGLVAPQYPGGPAAMDRFIRENIRYPRQALADGVEGTVYVTCVVEPNGKLKNVAVSESSGTDFDKEAVRVVKAMPGWQPGSHQGRAVRTTLTIPVHFRIPRAADDGQPVATGGPAADPQYPGGAAAMDSYIQAHLRYPSAALAERLEGTVYVRVSIAADGSVTDAVVASPSGTALDAEAARVARSLPRWTPAALDGRAVASTAVVPVRFVLPAHVDAPAEAAAADGAASAGGIERMPQYPGGAAAMMAFISKNVRYPKSCVDARIEGQVQVSATVGADGSLSDAAVAAPVHPDLDAEALRVVKLMPRWQPAVAGGSPCSVRFTIPVIFRLPFGDSHVDWKNWDDQRLKTK